MSLIIKINEAWAPVYIFRSIDLKFDRVMSFAMILMYRNRTTDVIALTMVFLAKID